MKQEITHLYTAQEQEKEIRTLRRLRAGSIGAAGAVLAAAALIGIHGHNSAEHEPIRGNTKVAVGETLFIGSKTEQTRIFKDTSVDSASGDAVTAKTLKPGEYMLLYSPIIVNEPGRTLVAVKNNPNEGYTESNTYYINGDQIFSLNGQTPEAAFERAVTADITATTVTKQSTGEVLPDVGTSHILSQQEIQDLGL